MVANSTLAGKNQGEPQLRVKPKSVGSSGNAHTTIDERSWEREGRRWPNREASRFVRAANMSWHVQEMGTGPVLLLLHGTGASTHSWRKLAPILAQQFRVVVPDLPGHGFTQSAPREFLSLSGMGWAVSALLRHLSTPPAIVVGHSAGAAIAARMSIDGHIAPQLIVGVNAALLPLQGLAGHLFSPLAKLLARVPFVPQLLARRAFDRVLIEKMLADTGSKLDREGIDFYWKLAQSPKHIAAAFGMMAEWDLPRLEKELHKLCTGLLLIAASHDRSISPFDAERVRTILPDTTVVPINGLGHLAHEEQPECIADIIFRAASETGIMKNRK